MYTPHWFKKVFDADVEAPQCDVGKAIIGSDVWIGCNATIIGDVHIGHGAVIGAGSVVLDDVEPYTIVAGNPARVIKKRFSDDLIARLLKLQWWNFDMDKIKAISHYLSVELNEQVMQALENA